MANKTHRRSLGLKEDSSILADHDGIGASRHGARTNGVAGDRRIDDLGRRIATRHLRAHLGRYVIAAIRDRRLVDVIKLGAIGPSGGNDLGTSDGQFVYGFLRAYSGRMQGRNQLTADPGGGGKR